MAHSPIERVREAVRTAQHSFSRHALRELRADNLHPVDAESALLTGAVIGTYDRPGAPGPCYSVLGTAADLTTKITVVCRFEPERQLLVITCYEIK